MLITAVLSSHWWLPSIATFLDVSEPLQPADAVLILPGSEDARPEMAADLILAGIARIALIPETSLPSDPPSVPAAASTTRTRNILRRRGVPEAHIIVIGGHSRSTYGDAESLARYLQTSPLSNVIVVTNAWHTRRARVAIQHALAGSPTKVQFGSVPNRAGTNRWWIDQAGRNGILTEWVKLLCYVAIYGDGWRWCVVLALTCVTIAAARRYANQCRAKEPKHVGVRNK